MSPLIIPNIFWFCIAHFLKNGYPELSLRSVKFIEFETEQKFVAIKIGNIINKPGPRPSPRCPAPNVTVGGKVIGGCSALNTILEVVPADMHDATIIPVTGQQGGTELEKEWVRQTIILEYNAFLYVFKKPTDRLSY